MKLFNHLRWVFKKSFITFLKLYPRILVYFLSASNSEPLKAKCTKAITKIFYNFKNKLYGVFKIETEMNKNKKRIFIK